jgi:hypothetical protein
MDLALRPMSTSQILDRTFQLYRRNFILFAGIATLPPALLLVAQMLGLIGGSAGPKTSPSFNTVYIVGFVAGAALFLGIYLLGYSLTMGANIFAVSRVHLGKETTIGDSYREIKPYAGRIVVIVILGFLIVFGLMLVGGLAIAAPAFAMSASKNAALNIILGVIGLVALIVCVIWAIRLGASFALAAPACVLEKLGAVESLRRSRVLAKGSVQRIILVNFLAGVIAVALSAVLDIPSYIGAASGAAQHSLPLQIWGIVAAFCASTLAGPIATISIALIYYDERVRKEAFDLQLMMEAVGMAQPAQAQAAKAAGSGPAPTIG